MKFSHTSNVRSVIKDMNMAAAEARPAVVRALNKTIAKAKTRASREVRSAGYKLKASDIKDAIRIVKASSSRLRANAIASGRPLALMKYGARQVGTGVSVDVMNGRKVVAHAFIANSKNGTPQVFLREPGAKAKKVVANGKTKWSTLPIRKLFGPSLPDALANEKVTKAIVSLIEESFPAILVHEHEWLRKRLTRLPPIPAD